MYDMEVLEGPRPKPVDVVVAKADGARYVRMEAGEETVFWYNPESKQVVNPNKHRQLEELYANQ